MAARVFKKLKTPATFDLTSKTPIKKSIEPIDLTSDVDESNVVEKPLEKIDSPATDLNEFNRWGDWRGAPNSDSEFSRFGSENLNAWHQCARSAEPKWDVPEDSKYVIRRS